jgi:uncharacterized protein (TIGR01777 family)
MRIAITGSSGLIGKALIRALESDGHSVTPLVRRESSRGVRWDPAKQQIDLEGLEGIDALVHLAGESIAGLWTRAKKQRIRASRVNGTKLIATSLTKLRHPPAVFVSASAIGYYGDRNPADPVDESGDKGSGFLADVVEEWEAAALPASKAGIRVVHPRFGMVLSRDGGSLGTVLPIFKAGLGGRIGSGRQVWSWVAIDDVVGGIMKCLAEPELHGPVNVVAPLPVTNLAFTRTLGRVLRRPTILGVPAPLLSTVGGQMARELLLSGARVVPRKLQQAGYAFRYPELEQALRHVLGPK